MYFTACFQCACVSWVSMYFTSAVCVMLFHVFYSCSVCHAFPCILQQQQCASWVSMYFIAAVCHAFPCILQQQYVCHAFHVIDSHSVSWFSMCLAALFNSPMSTAHFNDQSRSAYFHTDIAFKLRFCIPNILVLLHHVICPPKTLYIQTSFLPSIHHSIHPYINSGASFLTYNYEFQNGDIYT